MESYLLKKRLDRVTKTLIHAKIRLVQNEMAISRLGRFLSDKKKIFRPKELLDFGHQDEHIGTYIAEMEVLGKLLETAEDKTISSRGRNRKIVDLQQQWAEIQEKRAEMALSRAMKHKFDHTTIKRYKETVKDIKNFKKSLKHKLHEVS
ncbi:hypothetical protein HYV81_01580 [Candidatus Woesearchaeota archaeon]|nr:hypothetical protein [Candidatus Woesearchaeota archaeon]